MKLNFGCIVVLAFTAAFWAIVFALARYAFTSGMFNDFPWIDALCAAGILAVCLWAFWQSSKPRAEELRRER